MVTEQMANIKKKKKMKMAANLMKGAMSLREKTTIITAWSYLGHFISSYVVQDIKKKKTGKKILERERCQQILQRDNIIKGKKKLLMLPVHTCWIILLVVIMLRQDNILL